MELLGAIVGAVFGFVAGHDAVWAIAGGVLGYLAVDAAKLRSRVAALEREAMNRQWQAAVSADAATVQTASPVSDASIPLPEVPAPASPAVAESVASASDQSNAPSTSAPPLSNASDIFDRAVNRVVKRARDFFTGGNTVVRVGVVVLFFGVAFLLKYAAEHSQLPVELRLVGVALAAVILLVIGARLRPTREAYAMALEGAGIGILYLVVFAAFRLYTLLPGPLAFVLLVAICALSAVLALLQNSQALAVIGVAGGFLAPVLVSTGQGSHVMLFSYYAILNLGILALAWFRAWRALNLIGFGFTFAIGATWGYRYYQPEFFASTEPFLVLFFLLYVAVALLFARRQPPALRDPVDGTLIFGVPIVGFLLQSALVKDYAYALAESALALGAFYLTLAWLAQRRRRAPLLAQAFIALGAIFATLTIPLAVDGYWTAAAWAVEGAGVVWIGLRQSRWLARAFGLLVQVGAGIFFLSEIAREPGISVLNREYLGCLLLAAAGVVSAWLMFRNRERITAPERFIGVAMLAWGFGWWFGGSLREIGLHVGAEYRQFARLILIAATGLAQEISGRRLVWPALHYASALNLGFLVVAFAWAVGFLAHPFAGFGFIAWPAAFGVHYYVLKTHEIAQLNVGRTLRHAVALWLVVLLLGFEIEWVLRQWLPASDWAAGAVGLLLALAMIGSVLANRQWPVRDNERAYRIAAIPLAVLAYVWLVHQGMLEPGNAAPLEFVPILNPLDIGALSVLLAFWIWIGGILRRRRSLAQPLWIGFGIGAFGWANAALFRALHHLADIPYALDAMLHSTLAQSALSIFWTTLAFLSMLFAARSRQRMVWLVGAALLGVVVVKLFVVDLSNTGTLARIVSFVSVGLLLLLIGYLVPVPPKSTNQAEKQ